MVRLSDRGHICKEKNLNIYNCILIIDLINKFSTKFFVFVMYINMKYRPLQWGCRLGCKTNP